MSEVEAVRKLAEEIAGEPLAIIESRLRAFMAERDERLLQEAREATGRDDSWIEEAARRICQETGLENQGLVERLIADVHLPQADRQLTLGLTLVQRMRRAEAGRDRALGESAGLREVLVGCIRTLVLGIDRAERAGVRGPLRPAALCARDDARTALASSPLAEKAGEVLEVVGRTVEAFRRESSKEEHAELAREVTAKWDALRAELHKGGEGG